MFFTMLDYIISINDWPFVTDGHFFYIYKRKNHIFVQLSGFKFHEI